MKRDLRLLVQFNHKSGPDAVLETLQSRLPGAKRERESLVYRNNVLSFGKGVLAGHRGEFDYEISVFPLDQDPAFEIQRGLLKEVRTATQCSARRTRSRFLWTIRSWLKPLKEQAAEATFAVVEHPLVESSFMELKRGRACFQLGTPWRMSPTHSGSGHGRHPEPRSRVLPLAFRGFVGQ